MGDDDRGVGGRGGVDDVVINDIRGVGGVDILCYYADHNEVIGAGRSGIVGVIVGVIVGAGSSGGMVHDDRSGDMVDNDVTIDDIRGGSRWYTMLLYYTDGGNDDIAGGGGVELCARNAGDDSMVCLYLWCCLILLFIVHFVVCYLLLMFLHTSFYS